MIDLENQEKYQFAKDQKRASIIPFSDFATFCLSHSGYEFYHRKNNEKAHLWEIHETYTNGEIEMIMEDKNGTIGYRVKEV